MPTTLSPTPRPGVTRAVAALLALIVAAALAACSSGAVISENSSDSDGNGSGGLNSASVPAEFVGPLTQYGNQCAGISPGLLAAQISAESNFKKGSVSSTGALGYSQFMPETWAAYGGGGDPNNPDDAVKAQAKYDCELYDIATKQRGCTGDDAQKAMLAMYNAGPGGVSGCTVPINGQTETYVPKILAAVARFAGPATGAAVDAKAGEPFVYDPSKTPGQNAVAAAMSQIGITYAWGGGTLDGPGKGTTDGGVADQHGDYNKIGWDCSGLSRFAIWQGSNHTVQIGRTTGEQEGQGVDVTGPPQAGDLILYPGHVAIARGDGTMIEAPESGDVVKVSPLRPGHVKRYLSPTGNQTAAQPDAA